MAAYPTNDFTAEDAFGSGNEALIAQQMRIAQRQKLVDSQTVQAPKAPEGQMVSGIYVKPSMGQQLAPFISNAITSFQQASINEDSSKLDRQTAAAKGQLIQRAATAKTPQEKAQIAGLMYQVPGMEKWGDMFSKDQVIDEPVREEARAATKDLKQTAIAEAQRKQTEDLAYRRERDAQTDQQRRDLATQHNETMVALKGMGGGGGSGGDKASNYQIFQDKEGNLTQVNKLTGATMPLGAGGKPSSTTEKTQADAAKQVKNADAALTLLSEMKPMISTATSSGFGKMRDSALSFGNVSTKAGDAAGELKTKARTLATFADRGMFGPQFSDADVKALNQSVGDLGNPDIPESRKQAIFKSVVQKFQQQKGGDAAPVADPGVRPFMDAAVKTVIGSDGKPRVQAGAPRMKFNPATGQLE